ncbi:NAD(P)/FAD-dependent oxidoreductase [Rhodococcus erythropolis]|uniref:flavin-containing monooxygenase n=1 Tax=Rhodococcus erythropolis TaxID=1833 RepID=UPI002948D765|nr:NAD(P)/FAD-dependent oxidoreductase [Rhodococcus erythropolis]MDV6211953.1 NAD(P)/FAD-dependent oxidoreductase [Rhodococcus erythropolis]
MHECEIRHPEPTIFTDEELRDALAVANLPSLLPALAQLTGAPFWTEQIEHLTSPRDLGDHDGGGLDPEQQERIRAEAFDVLAYWRDGLLDRAPTPTPEELVRLMSASLGDSLPVDYGGLLGEEMGIYPRSALSTESANHGGLHTIIIGAGLSGLCLAIRLEQAGTPYTIIEKNPDVGGTWYENTYPGCGVDTPSNLYSLSFEPNPDWTRYFSGRDELEQYWRDLADKWQIRQHIRFETEAVSARWNEENSSWQVTTRTADGSVGVIAGEMLVSAVGLLNQPGTPQIDGLADFEGPVVHTGRWDNDVDIAGKRVAVVGTGASAMQFVPAAADVSAEVRVFQRSPQWAVPHPNYRRDVPEGVKFLNRHVPYYQAWYRLRIFWLMGDRVHGLLQIDPEFAHPERAINRGNDRLRAALTAHIERELEGRPDLLAKSVPNYPPYGKRLLMDNGWFRTIRRDNVDLVTDVIDAITPTGIRTVDGSEYDADIIVLATGFNAVQVLGSIEVIGRGGASLHEKWGDDDGRAYLGMTVPGFPNFLCLYGPNTNTGHGGTVIAGTEMQVNYATQMIATMLDHGLSSMDVHQDIFDAYDRELSDALDRTIWMHPGMTSYYQNSRGRIVTNSPWQYIEYWRRIRKLRLDDYATTPRSEMLAVAGQTPIEGQN